MKTEVMNTLIAKKCYHSVYCKVTLQDTEEHHLLRQRMGAMCSSEMPLNSYKLHIVMSHKPVVFTVADVRTSILTYCKVSEETAEADSRCTYVHLYAYNVTFWGHGCNVDTSSTILTA